MWQKHKVSKVSILILTSLFILGLINVINIPKVFAAVTIYQQNTSAACNNTSSCAQLFSLTVISGDILVATQIVNSITVTPTFSDTGGATWHTTCSATAFEQPCTSWAIATTSAADTVTVTWGGTHTGFIKVLEIQGGDSTNICIKTNHAASGTAVSTATSCTWTSTTAFGMFTVGTGSATHTCTTPSGWTDGSFGAGAQVKYFVGSGVSSPTNFACTLSGSDLWDEVGMLIPESIPLVTQPLSICTQEPGSSPLSIMIPLYETPGADWTTIENSALANPALKYTIIFNPSSGPGASFSSSYNTAINTMINDGVRVLGYIPTKYTHQPVITVENNITKYTTFYPQINGIFFDQVGMTAGNFSYYITLVSFVNTQNYKFSYTVGNPGVGVSNLLYNVFSDLNIWEKTGTPSNLILSVVTANPASQFSFIANGISTGADTNSTYLMTVTPYVGNVYITSNSLYNSLPSYFATLVSNLVSTATGAPQATFALSGTANPSPSTLLSNNKGSCVFTNITVTPSSTLTITVPTAGTFTRFVMNSSSTSSTTENITTCSSGTCPNKQIDTYYQIANAYAAQAIKPTLFNGAYNLPINGTNAGASSSIILPILVNTNQATSGLLYFDYGTVSMPTSFMIKSLLWSATPTSSATISNTNSGDFTLIVGYSGSNFTLVSTVTITKQVEKTVIVTNQQTQCIDTNSCGSNQLGSFLILLLPALIIIGIFEYIPYVLGAKDGRIYVLTFMFAISIVGFLSSLGAFGVNAIPWYIPIFIDIMGFMIILTYKPDSSGF